MRTVSTSASSLAGDDWEVNPCMTSCLNLWPSFYLMPKSMLDSFSQWFMSRWSTNVRFVVFGGQHMSAFKARAAAKWVSKDFATIRRSQMINMLPSYNLCFTQHVMHFLLLKKKVKVIQNKDHRDFWQIIVGVSRKMLCMRNVFLGE